ncbi:MAG: tetratricopeptide repeat protein [Candidatus Micrarchaeota archaeon]|nr:tetratricopeptide repeat protein [Candidatus Micrarchaeota archaeon]
MLLFQVKQAYQPAQTGAPEQHRKGGFMAERHGWAGCEMIEIEGKARGLPQAKINEIKRHYQDFVSTCYNALVHDNKLVRMKDDWRRLGMSPDYDNRDFLSIWKDVSSCFWSNCTYSETVFLSEAFDKDRKAEFRFNIPSQASKFMSDETKIFELSSADLAAIKAGGHVKKKGAGVSYDVFIKDGEIKAVGTGRFIDCDTSAYAIADVLAKLGIETNIVYLPGHAILNVGTHSLYIETTGDVRTMEVSTTVYYESFAVEDKYKTAGVLLPFSPKIAYLFSGKAYSTDKKYNLAVEEFGKFIEAYPNVWDVYLSRGEAYGGLGNYDLAIADYHRADKLSLNNIGVKSDFAYLYSRQNKHDLAIEYFNAAIKLAEAGKSNSAGFTSALFENRGKELAKIGKYNEAIGDFTKALAADKDNFLIYSIYESRADAYAALKKYDLAAADYEKVAKERYSTRAVDEYIKCAEMFMSAGRPAKAAIYYLKALDAENYNAKAQVGCGRALYQMKRYDLAAKHFSAAMYENIEAAMMAGKCYYLQKNYKEAHRAYSQVTMDYKDPQSDSYKNISAAQYAEACIGCGFALIGTKDFKPAKNNFSMAIKEAPGNPEAYYGRGLAQYSLKQYGAALADFSAAIACSSKNADAYFQRAETYAAMGKFVHASVNYKMAADIHKERHDKGKAQEALQKSEECGSKPNLR